MRRNKFLLIESAVALAEVETRARPSLTGAACSLRIPVSMAARAQKERNPRWTAEEDDYLRENLGFLSDEAMAAPPGRTVTAVNERWKRDLHLVPPRQDPRWLSANQIGNGLEKDAKSIHNLVDRGILPGRRLPLRMVTRVVDRRELLRWLLDPMHWCYFDPHKVGRFQSRECKRRIGHPDIVFWRQARKQVLERRREWKDEWLRTGEAAKAIGFKRGKWHTGAGRLDHAILSGILKGTKWGNWWILRSEIERFARENVVKKPGYKVARIQFHPGFLNRTPAEWKRIIRKRMQSAWFLEMRRRNVGIRRRIRSGEDPAALAKEFRMTKARIKQIEKNK